MPRIAGRSRDETRRAALAASRQAFGVLGLSGASLAHIAEQAGVTAATLCHHFGGKQGLYDAATDEVYAELGALAQSIDPRLSLAELIDAVYAHAERNAEGIRFLMRQIAERGGIPTRVRNRHVRPWLERLSQLISARFEVDEQAAGTAIVALGHLTMRFITNSAEDNRVALAAANAAETRRRIIAILIGTAEHLMGLCPAASRRKTAS
jgi:AcrR family transcriptional regulator